MDCKFSKSTYKILITALVLAFFIISFVTADCVKVPNQDCINREAQAQAYNANENNNTTIVVSCSEYTEQCNSSPTVTQVIQNNNIISAPVINATEACNGCLVGENCVSFGYRLNGTYCDLSKSFISQKGVNQLCNNNFECQSNVCASGKCISSGLISQILNWFSHLFG